MKPLNQNKMADIIRELSDIESTRSVCHQQHEGTPMPSVDLLTQTVALFRSIIFPGYFGNASVNNKNLKEHISQGVDKLSSLLSEQILAGLCFDLTVGANKKACVQKASDITAKFIASLPKLRVSLSNDVIAAYNGDPAAKNYSEIIFCYPAIKAISNYRFAHELLMLGVPVIPRIITEMAHSETGIDIHPGAKISEFFTIDHGTGVVIGETAIIGRNVKIYQGVTLGAKSFPLDADGNPIKGIDRHPILEDDVIVYSNATILGRITIGKGAVIGGNVWVDSDVSAGSKILQKK